VEKLGADVCLNYKSPTFKEDFKKETPAADGFIDVYFDNVAGEILDLVLSRMAQNSRLAACGAISAYNTSTERTTGIKSWFEIVIMRIKVHGFIVLDFMEDFPRALEELRQALADGKLQIEGGETVVSGSFEDVPKTWLKLFDGSNQGKLVTHIN
jgi:NADPH-dependent curcumin reductase CurA